VALVMAGGWPMEVDQYIARDPSRAVNDRRIPSGTELYAPIITTANLLGYTVYGVDMPGLMSRTGADASQAASTVGTGLGFAEFVQEGELHNSLHYISVETGGMPFLNGQRITSLSEVGRDVDSFYWLSFSPGWERDDRSHDIVVEVSDPKLRVRHRAEYTDVSVQAQLAMAVRSSLLYGPFGVSDELKVEVVEAEKAAKKRFDVTIKVTVPMDKLTIVETDKGFHAQAMLFMAAIDPNGGRSDIPSVPLAIVAPVPPKPGDEVDYQTTVQLHRKTSRLTVALLDVVSGETLVTTITKD
jgi:hypothetical protein